MLDRSIATWCFKQLKLGERADQREIAVVQNDVVQDATRGHVESYLIVRQHRFIADGVIGKANRPTFVAAGMARRGRRRLAAAR